MDRVNAVAFSPNGRYVVTGSNDSTARVWNITNLKAIKSYPLRGHRNAVIVAAFSPNSKYVITGFDDGTVRVWISCSVSLEGMVTMVANVKRSQSS